MGNMDGFFKNLVFKVCYFLSKEKKFSEKCNFSFILLIIVKMVGKVSLRF